jgi:penicillin-binding protein 2
LGKIYSENIVNSPKQGKEIITTIDSRIQKELFLLIKNLADNGSFTGGAGMIMDTEKGEIITATSFPEYNSEILSQGKDTEKIKNYINDKRKVFLDRNISGLYTPGSIVKPFFALGALAENIIDPYKKILSTGSISIPNPYFPDQKSVFKDWKAHGWTNMMEALAVSSDVYFYEIGGGFEDQKGLGIANLEKYAKLFGVGTETGVDLPDEKNGTIPSPEWKEKNFKGDPWRVGDTYNTAIGQYGFQVTLIEMLRAVGAIANYGKLLTPHFVLGDTEKEQNIQQIELNKESYKYIHEGMRNAVTFGTAVAINVPYVEAAAKTGTAQVGLSKNKVNSWIIGFFPYENPKYAFAVMMESGPSSGSVGASSVMRQLLDWMSIHTHEYFN